MIPLTTARLSLRPFADTDLEFVREVHTSPALMRFIPAAYTPDDNAARRILQRFMTLRDHSRVLASSSCVVVRTPARPSR